MDILFRLPDRSVSIMHHHKSGGMQTAILDAAKTLFAQQGFDAVSMSAIACKAGVSKGNLFHHFGGKQELHEAVLRAACERAAIALRLPQGDASFQQRSVAAYVRRHLAVLEEDPERAQLVLRALLHSAPERGQGLAERVFGENFGSLAALFREGQQSGCCRKDLDPGLVAFVLLSANVMLFQSRYIMRHLPEAEFAADHDKYAQMLADLLNNGICPCPAGGAATTG